jgi:hypothetical protein
MADADSREKALLEYQKEQRTRVRQIFEGKEKVVLEYYKEQLTHGRHIEVQRSTLAAIVFAATGAIIGRLLTTGLTREQLPYTTTLLVLGLFSLLLNAKLYERFRLHNEVAKIARNSLNPELAEFRKQAEAVNRIKYRVLFAIKLHIVWGCFFSVVAILGAVLTGLLFCKK